LTLGEAVVWALAKPMLVAKTRGSKAAMRMVVSLVDGQKKRRHRKTHSSYKRLISLRNRTNLCSAGVLLASTLAQRGAIKRQRLIALLH
jgi:hypothetical protein